MAELKALVNASNGHSPMFSDNSSCQVPVNKEGAADKRNVGVAGPQSCELALDCIENMVAFGTVFNDHEEMNVSPEASVPVPIPGEIEVVRQAVGSHVAWPRELIIYPSVAKKKKEVLHGQSKRKDELQKLQHDYSKMKLNKNVPKKYKVLYKYVVVFIKATGESIPIPYDSDVFGTEKTIYILHENVKALLEFDMIGQAAISAYMALLQRLIKIERKNDDVVLYGFFDLGATFTLNKSFHSYFVNRLKESIPYRICHWILVVVWDGDIYILNPLPHPTYFDELEKSLTEAMKSYNAQTGRGNKAPQIKNILGSPKQPGGVECGYVVMRYMKDIIDDKELSFTTKLPPVFSGEATHACVAPVY
ncbi:uncharacterized protein LOC141665408 [Apium graveolens]|uniref:uncharacterized protein LOC141665408 n=1 Tax=Apium graveolens TaxID=4045 RepID=UPI003D7BFE10